MTSRAPFRADQVGSLLRPQQIKEARTARSEGRIDASALREIEDRCIRDVVRRQEESGIRRAAAVVPAASRQCVDCHAQGTPAIIEHWKGSTHSEKGVGCIDCHSPHVATQPSLLAQPVAEGCLSCHPGDGKDFAAAHLGLPAKTLACGSCHDPHAAKDRGLLLPVAHPPFAERACDTCHTDAAVAGGAR